jgi:hypothetical protein
MRPSSRLRVPPRTPVTAGCRHWPHHADAPPSVRARAGGARRSGVLERRRSGGLLKRARCYRVNRWRPNRHPPLTERWRQINRSGSKVRTRRASVSRRQRLWASPRWATAA